jgi:solute carrier family 25 protein 38
VIKETGIAGLWRGLLPTFLRDAYFSGIYLVFYRRQLQLFDERSNLWLRFLCGLSAGFAASLITQPFDIVKTVILLYPEKFKSIFGTSVELYKVSLNDKKNLNISFRRVARKSSLPVFCCESQNAL